MGSPVGDSGAVSVLTIDGLGYVAGGAFALWALAIGVTTRRGCQKPDPP